MTTEENRIWAVVVSLDIRTSGNIVVLLCLRIDEIRILDFTGVQNMLMQAAYLHELNSQTYIY